MNSALLNKHVQEFISKHYKDDLSKTIFSGSPFPDVTIQELAIQLAGKLKSEKKLPTWFSSKNVIFPPALNLEQASSEKTAEYKSNLISGKVLADLTGGFGIDAHYFARKFEKVVHCEVNQELSEIVAHNEKIFGNGNLQFFNGDGFAFLRNSQDKFDWIYLDPARRDETGGKVFRISEMTPNVPENFDLLWQKSDNILLKTSPLLDLSMGIQELENVREIHIVAVGNEVKELLWLLQKEGASGEIRVKTVNLQKKEIQEYTNFFGRSFTPEFGFPQEYLYEPNSALMKSGFFDAVAHDFNLKKLHQNTQLYTSDKLVAFPGRRFKISKCVAARKKEIKRECQFKKAHISTRNFPQSVKYLRNKFGIKDGGDDYLFFTTLQNEENVVLICKKAEI